MTPLDIEKLKALGFSAKKDVDEGNWHPWLDDESMDAGPFETEAEAWAHCKSYAQSEFGMLVLMAGKVRWLNNHFKDSGAVEMWGGDDPLCPESERYIAEVEGEYTARSPSPQAALDELFWAVA